MKGSKSGDAQGSRRDATPPSDSNPIRACDIIPRSGTCLALNRRGSSRCLSSRRSGRWVFKKHIPSIWHCAPPDGHSPAAGERGRGEIEGSRY